MPIIYCEICDNYINLDTDQEHIEICKEDRVQGVIDKVFEPANIFFKQADNFINKYKEN